MCLGALSVFDDLRLFSSIPSLVFSETGFGSFEAAFLCKSRGVWGSGSTKYEANETRLPNWQDCWRSQSRHSHAQTAFCSWLNRSYTEAAWGIC